jgi:hypothetical protein
MSFLAQVVQLLSVTSKRVTDKRSGATLSVLPTPRTDKTDKMVMQVEIARPNNHSARHLPPQRSVFGRAGGFFTTSAGRPGGFR